MGNEHDYRFRFQPTLRAEEDARYFSHRSMTYRRQKFRYKTLQDSPCIFAPCQRSKFDLEFHTRFRSHISKELTVAGFWSSAFGFEIFDVQGNSSLKRPRVLLIFQTLQEYLIQSSQRKLCFHVPVYFEHYDVPVFHQPPQLEKICI